jgi:alkylhydroperoxidase/carboxymuconolactone decarboxylase family protein YurZ
LEKLCEWDPEWAEKYLKMSTNPSTNGILPSKLVELISLGLSSACTNLQAEGTRQHIRAALEAGATREEILTVLKCGSVMAIHSCSLGAPILLEEAAKIGVKPVQIERRASTPAVDKMRAIGQWNEAWDPFFQLDPVWTDAFMASGSGIYVGGVFSPKDLELMSLAFDASITHMYAPGTRRHISAALKAGATMEEIMEVLKICVAQGVYTCVLGVPILAEELKRKRRSTARKAKK